MGAERRGRRRVTVQKGFRIKAKVTVRVSLVSLVSASSMNNNMARVTRSVSVKRRHSVFDAQNFGQNAQKRKTVRQVTQRIFR